MTLPPEWIVNNFRNGTSHPLQRAAEELRRMAEAYAELSARFDVMRETTSSAWTGPAATASDDRADPLRAAMTESVELLDAFARATSDQAAAFETARNSVVSMPPKPDKLDVLGMVRAAVHHGPAAPFERATDHQDVVRAYEEAARHNVAVYDEYYWSTTDHKIPAEYPKPQWADRGPDPGVTTPSDAGHPDVHTPPAAAVVRDGPPPPTPLPPTPPTGGSGVGPGRDGAVPAGYADREDDQEHDRPEYLDEPDSDGIFGSDRSASSPVIGATWQPEQR